MTLFEQISVAYNNAWINCQLRLLQAKHTRLVADLAELDKSPLAQMSRETQTLFAERISARITETRVLMERLGYRVPPNEHPIRSPMLTPRRVVLRRAVGQ